MLLKKVYVFASRWGSGSTSYHQYCLDNNIVFINNKQDSKTDFPKIARGVKKGDIIALRDGQTMYAVGIANNDAEVKNVLSGKPLFESNEDIKQYGIDDDVELVYVTIDTWKILNEEEKQAFYLSGLQDRVKELVNDKYANAREKILDISKENLEQKMKEKELIYSTEQILTYNHNLILTGAPGTGKTYLAKQIAAKMIFGEDITLKEIEDNEAKKAKFEYQYKFVQFHPSYDYTDFVEGIRPVTKEDNSYGFIRKDGTFKEFCKRAVYINIDYNKLVISKLKEFCEYLLKETRNNKIEIENVRGIKNAAAPIKSVIYNQDNETIKIVVDTDSGNNGISTTSLHKIADWYLLYITKFLELDKEQQTMKTFDNILNITYGGSHTYIYGFIKLFHDRYGKELQFPSYYKIDKNDKTPFIFVIDEINRGDINKILGELFYAIDTGYRGEKGMVDTQYQNLVESGDIFAKGFYIPENVYIIGTMNDIDRSVESMDFAIRRRFAWKEITPEETAEEILKDVKVVGAYSVLTDLNNFIASVEGLGKMYQIGASYFLKLNSYVKNGNITANEAYTKLWNNHLKGLFYEYVRGKKNADDIFSNIENTYFNTVNEILAN